MLTEPTGNRMTPFIMHKSPAERAVLILGFMALFPGFFFYHFLLGMGLIRAFLGGYFTPVSLLIALPLVILYIRQIRSDFRRLLPCELYYGLFFVFFAAIVAANAANGANLVIVIAHLEGMLFMTNVFILFKMIDFTAQQFRYPAILCLIGMSAIIISFSAEGMFRMDALGLSKDPAALSTYQGLARSYLVTLLCVVNYTRSLTLRVVIYSVGAASLFLNTARSEFVAMLFVIPIIELYFTKKKVLFILILASLAGLVVMNADLIEAQLPNNRILELLDLSHSNSAILRHQMMAQAAQTVSAHPILGDYASYENGHYAHNIFSAWVDLGIIGFIYLAALMILPTASMIITGYFRTRDRGDFILAFATACATMLLLIKSHYFTDMLIGASIGAYSKYRYGENHLRQQSRDPISIITHRSSPL